MPLPSCFILFLLLRMASAQFDNEIVGEPVVQCSETAITFTIRTRNPFRGNIFIRNFFNNPNCRLEYHNNDYPGASFSVRITECGMQRIRQLQPPGMNYLLVFTTSFHPQLITKNDRSYNVRCFYSQIDQIVDNGLSVSPIPTQNLEQATVVKPDCAYSIRLGTVDGPVASHVNVGDKVVHRWECANSNYGMLVKNCVVNSGVQGGVSVQTVDDRGCPVAQSNIQAPLVYDSTGLLVTATIETFMFPDSAKTAFNCQIEVCSKIDHQCLGITPPNCPKQQPAGFRRGASVVEDDGVNPTQIISHMEAMEIPPEYDLEDTYTTDSTLADIHLLQDRFVFGEGGHRQHRPFDKKVQRDETPIADTHDTREQKNVISAAPTAAPLVTFPTLRSSLGWTSTSTSATTSSPEETTTSPASPSTTPDQSSSTNTPPVVLFPFLEGGGTLTFPRFRSVPTFSQMSPTAVFPFVLTPPPTSPIQMTTTEEATTLETETTEEPTTSSPPEDIRQSRKHRAEPLRAARENVFDVSAEVMVDQKESEIGNAVTDSQFSRPIPSLTCLDRNVLVTVSTVFAFCMIFAVVGVGFLLKECYAGVCTSRREDSMGDRLSTRCASECSSSVTESVAHPAYFGSRQLGQNRPAYVMRIT